MFGVRPVAKCGSEALTNKTEVQSDCTSGAISPRQHETFPQRSASVSAFFFLLSGDPQLSLMMVDLVAFYGSIISVSFNDKELFTEVGPA